MENSTEKKFPANQQRIAGTIKDSKLNEASDKINLTIVTPGDKPKYLKVLISGSERVTNFLNHAADAKKAFPDEPVHLALTGSANFAKNGPHDNNTLIVLDNLADASSERFVMPKSTEQLEEFKKTYHARAEEVNQVKITGRLTKDPEFHPGTEKYPEFASVSFAHNYTDKAGESQVMYANVNIPNAQLQQFKDAGFSKGTTVKLDAQVQPKSYQKSGESVYTFNLVSRSIVPDLSKLVEKTSEAPTMEAASQKDQKEKEVKTPDAKKDKTAAAEKAPAAKKSGPKR